MEAPTKSKPSSMRVYKTWKGNNRFFWGGRLILGPDLTSLLITVLLVSAPTLTFCVQVYRKMKYHVIHSKDHEVDDRSKVLGFHVLIVTMAGLILDLIFLFLTSSRDPGIVPRNKEPPESDEFSVNTPSMEWLNGRTPHLRLPRTKDVTVNGFTVKVKYCDTCQLYRPPRASHCSICNNCVQKFDHHCPWVDQCVGLTTYENFRYRYEKKENPYNKDMLRNFAEAFFSRIPPSMMDFRSWAVEEETYQEGGSPCPDIGMEVVMSSKDKGGVEMGGSSSYVETMLHNLDYTSTTDDHLNHREDAKADAQVVDEGAQVREDGTLLSAMSEEEGEGSHGTLASSADPDVHHPSA